MSVREHGTAGSTAVDPDVAQVRRALVELERAVGRLQAHHSETLGVRRLVSDVRRLLEDLDEIGDLPPAPAGNGPENLHYVSDTPYPPDLWRDCDDEGLGGRSRHS
ncbi:hypothetical protein [Cryptosporangium aurantiacum]|uniref:Uncharacterized protein n=1 Tax=Cryptosporangium aurantiacum TaxID=134849 RepID=A0A1M7QQH4_9ACTN|nr:hypothetical protein [Cryptosporangium aurantiacum]SHN33776.1 hypothetical protein SAMN05443668_105184 [Cryptosporangium aurantiacum]